MSALSTVLIRILNVSTALDYMSTPQRVPVNAAKVTHRSMLHILRFQNRTPDRVTNGTSVRTTKWYVC